MDVIGTIRTESGEESATCLKPLQHGPTPKFGRMLHAGSESHLSYPDENFVRITHRLFKLEHLKILDYGFGSGANMIHLLKKHRELSGVEVSASAIAHLRERLSNLRLAADLRYMDSPTIPFDDGSFDAVFAWQVLYYNNWQTLASLPDRNQSRSQAGRPVSRNDGRAGRLFAHS